MIQFPDCKYEFQNVSAFQIPARGVVRVTDAKIVDAGRIVFKGDRPNVYGCQTECFAIGPVPVNSQAYGSCVRAPVMQILYDTADGVPAYGQAWGPQSGTFKLKKNTGGFFCLGAPVNTTQGYALFAPLPMNNIIGKTITAAISKGFSGVVTIFAGTLGTETSTGFTITAWSRYGNVAINKMVRCAWNYDSQGWEIIAAEC